MPFFSFMMLLHMSFNGGKSFSQFLNTFRHAQLSSDSNTPHSESSVSLLMHYGNNNLLLK